MATFEQNKKIAKMNNPPTVGGYSDGSILVKWRGDHWVITPDGENIEVEKYLKKFPLSSYTQFGEGKPATRFPKQEEALKLLGDTYKLIETHSDGDLTIEVGGEKYVVTTAGDVFEERKFKKPKKKKEETKGYHLKAAQQKLMAEYDNPTIVTQRSNGDLVVLVKGKRRVFGYDGIDLAEEEFEKKWGKDATKAPSTKYAFTFGSTVCKEKPYFCKPREIEHVAWDADHTMWNLKFGIASSVTGPLKKIDEDTVIELSGGRGKAVQPWLKPVTPTTGYQYTDYYSQLGEGYGYLEEVEPEKSIEEIKEIMEGITEGLSNKDKEFLESISGTTGEEQKVYQLPPGKPPEEKKTDKEEHEVNRITLLPTFRQALDELGKRGIKSSVISLNTKDSVKRILEAFGIADRFIEIRDSWENKGKVFRDITDKHKLCPCKSIFVDDVYGNVSDVAKECGLALVIGKSGDVEKPMDIFKFIKG